MSTARSAKYVVASSLGGITFSPFSYNRLSVLKHKELIRKYKKIKIENFVVFTRKANLVS
jgi:hypothetical protein